MGNQIKKGDISVETQNIFPVIKKWLYSDKEIFLRELVSNACDAISKHKRLVSLGEAQAYDGNYRIDVKLDKEAKTITVSDNGIGMTSDEVEKYINQIALSGALDFIEKYEGKSEDAGNGIIGHFGLGFYSAFMICDKVEIDTRSYSGEAATHWIGNDSCEYEIEESDKESFGTDIILNVNDDEKEFLSADRIKSILNKFCSFMPYEIYFSEEGAEKKEDEKEEPINDINPLWQKKPSDCTHEEYCEFYKKVFGDFRDPLFYVHINADYPLNFKGILYFPPISHEYETLEGQVKLYYNQVFVADNIKEVIPEYLLVMKGVLDCPDLPLNVSRSYLQSNGYVSKISAHIVKKVADKLCSMYNLEKEKYEGIWENIKPFIEYGCMRDDKFCKKVKDVLIFKTTDGKYVTIKEYIASLGDKKKNIYYTNDEVRQSKYISMYKNENVDVLVMDKLIDSQFIGFLEHMLSEDEETKETKLMRVDSGIADILKSDDAQSRDAEKLIALFKDTIGKDSVTVTAENLRDDSVPAVLNLSEEERRFSEMMAMYSPDQKSTLPSKETLVLNLSNKTVAALYDACEKDGNEEEKKLIAKQIYMLALVTQRTLDADELRELISSSTDIIGHIKL